MLELIELECNSGFCLKLDYCFFWLEEWKFEISFSHFSSDEGAKVAIQTGSTIGFPYFTGIFYWKLVVLRLYLDRLFEWMVFQNEDWSPFSLIEDKDWLLFRGSQGINLCKFSP